MTDISFLYVTLPDRTHAESIGRTLVEEKLAACANILGEMTSIYRWEGKVEQNGEIAMLVKTTNERADAAISRIKALHPYEVPAIVKLPITGGFSPFLAWIKEETTA